MIVIGLIFLAHMLHAQPKEAGLVVSTEGVRMAPARMVYWGPDVRCVEKPEGDIFCECRGEKP